jgi:hypothetical protein
VAAVTAAGVGTVGAVVVVQEMQRSDDETRIESSPDALQSANAALQVEMA